MMRNNEAESEQLKHTPDLQLQQERRCMIYVDMYLGQGNHFTAGESNVYPDWKIAFLWQQAHILFSFILTPEFPSAETYPAFKYLFFISCLQELK